MKKLFTILTLAASILATSNVSAATIESDNTQHTISLSIVQDNPSRELLEAAVKEMQKMLNAILVDDEPRTVEALKKNVNWNMILRS